MTVLRLKNSYSKRVETFLPLDPEKKTVTMYSCGPTVYSFAHIGNFRSFLFADILRRVLERDGYSVRQVMNITDVGHMTEDHLADASGEDKLAKAARELGRDPYAVAAHFEAAFIEDARALALKIFQGADATNQDLHPRATEHIPEMLAMIQALLNRGFAYMSSDNRGEVYFDISKFSEYGKLSGKTLEELDVGARVEVRSGKKDPRDFALWKVDEKHLMQWDPHSQKGWQPKDYERYQKLLPDGVDKRLKAGFPGWHIECSAMSHAHLGSTIDIHTGGEDNVFPHHECEIAQSCGAYNVTTPAPEGAHDEGNERTTFARFWIHGRHLLVNNKKMSKSAGTFYTVRDLLSPLDNGREDLSEQLTKLGFPDGRVSANILRYALVSNQYSQPMNFSMALLEQAKNSCERLQSLYARLAEVAKPGEASSELRELLDVKTTDFDRALHDDLNTPRGLAALFGLVSELNQRELSPADAEAAKHCLEALDDVLGVLDRRRRSGLVSKLELTEWANEGAKLNFDELRSRDHVGQEEVHAALTLRQAARQAKNYQEADALRDWLKERGVLTEDTREGVRWKLSN